MKEFNIDNYIIKTKKSYNNNKSLQDPIWSNSLVIGDMHFGTHQNSTVWLKDQIGFLQKQVIPIIEHFKEFNIDSVVFLGDLFDSRQSLNVVIANELIKIMTEIIDISYKNSINVYLIGGNHDYYSSFADKQDINNYNILFNDEYKEKHKNLFIVTNKVSYIEKQSGRVMLLPWFETETTENLSKHLANASSDSTCHGIYCHTDTLGFNSNENKPVFVEFNKPVWSGHIHYRQLNHNNKIYQLGAACAFNFNDANQDRFIYIINEKNNSFIEIQNEITPVFKTFSYKENIIDFSSLDQNDYYKFYTRPEDIKQLRKLINEYGLKNTNLQLIFNNRLIKENTESINTVVNINDFIDNNIPDNLKKVYKDTIKKYQN